MKREITRTSRHGFSFAYIRHPKQKYWNCNGMSSSHNNAIIIDTESFIIIKIAITSTEYLCHSHKHTYCCWCFSVWHVICCINLPHNSISIFCINTICGDYIQNADKKSPSWACQDVESCNHWNDTTSLIALHQTRITCKPQLVSVRHFSLCVFVNVIGIRLSIIISNIVVLTLMVWILQW